MSTQVEYPLEGGCACKAVRYQVKTAPLIVHCCHCTWCQRETGSAFVINAVIESDRCVLLEGKTETVKTPSASRERPGDYTEKLTSFVRVGTLDEPNALPPNIHIFTSTKQKWVVIPADVPVLEAFYRVEETWSKESLERMEALKSAVERHEESTTERV
ncbi:hypothetical protein MaudMau93_004314 [Microsporum audouinii]